MLNVPISYCFQENAIKSNIHNKFSAHFDAVEAELKSSTVGMNILSLCSLVHSYVYMIKYLY